MTRRPESSTRHRDVIQTVRQLGLAYRDQIAANTNLSTATVARAVSDLVDAGLVRERTDRARSGNVGRPSVPVSLDDQRHMVIGVHIGRRIITVCLAGVDGNVLAVSTIAARMLSTRRLIDAVGSRIASMLERLPNRRPLAVGVVAPWRDLPYPHEPVATGIYAATGLPVEVADHIQAIATAEFASGRRRVYDGVTLYVYARDTVGFAVVWDGRIAHRDASRVGRLAHLPTGSKVPCPCGNTGCLEAAASDQAIAARAHQDGLTDRPEIGSLLGLAGRGDDEAHRRLVTRAELLGRSAAVVRDMLNPDRMILAGQAFTGYEPALSDVVAGFTDTTSLPPIDLAFTRFGTGVQAIAAGAVALHPVDRDPLGCVHGQRSGSSALASS